MLNEANIIANLKKAFPEHIGDDGAVIPGPGEERYVITKDILVEDVHFRLSYFDPSSLAYKALQVNLSDIAAMGATPKFVLLGISIPQNYARYVTDLLYYFSEHIKKAGLLLIGGDTTKSPDKLFFSITVIGSAAPENIKYRDTAKVGDVICVAGNLGKAHLGLIACEGAMNGFNEYKQAFLCPTAKLYEGKWLGEQLAVTSMMDSSDGLVLDLKRLCEVSHVAGRVDLEKLSPTPLFNSDCQALGLDPINVMLTGGEDYGLLFTVANKKYGELSKEFMNIFGYELKQIGQIMPGSDVTFSKNGQRKILNLKPFSHFGEVL